MYIYLYRIYEIKQTRYARALDPAAKGSGLRLSDVCGLFSAVGPARSLTDENISGKSRGEVNEKTRWTHVYEKAAQFSFKCHQHRRGFEVVGGFSGLTMGAPWRPMTSGRGPRLVGSMMQGEVM